MSNSSLPTRLAAGNLAYVQHDPPVSNHVRDGSSLNSQIIDSLPPGTVIKLAHGPVLNDGHIWWQIHQHGKQGERWTSEGSAGAYFLGSLSGRVIDPAALPSRLHTGDRAMVTIDPPDPNTLRKMHDTKAEKVGSLPPGAEMTILAGPVFNDGILFWEIETDQLAGWTGECNGTEYWLEPVMIQA